MQSDNPMTLPQTKAEFWKTYWFTPYQMVTLKNPKDTEYRFMVEMRHFVIKAGATEVLPGTVANVYLSQMTRVLAQDEDKTSFLSDFALMKQYYDRLIVSVESTINDVDTTPSYLKDVPAHMRTSGEPETPPWQQPKTTLPEHNSEMSDSYDPKVMNDKPKDVFPAKDEIKEFELGENKYKAVIKKGGGTMYYKDGKLTTSSEYQKAASLL
jgi:hypothetical protein